MKTIDDILVENGYFIGCTFEGINMNFDDNSLEIHIKSDVLVDENGVKSNPFLVKLKFLHIKSFGWDNSKYYSLMGNVNLSTLIDHVILKSEDEGISYLKIYFKDNRNLMVRFKLFSCITVYS